MFSHAEILGIDLVKLEAERFYYYPRKKQYEEVRVRQPELHPPVEESSQWVPIAKAANQLGYSVQTLRRWVDQRKVRAQKTKGRLFVYMPDAERHAGKPSSGD
jgi:hypothetical protein